MFVITTKKPLTREGMYGVDFRHGVGKTIHADKAHWFHQIHGYEVRVPAGFNIQKAWGEGKVNAPPTRGFDLEEDLDDLIDDDDGDADDDTEDDDAKGVTE